MNCRLYDIKMNYIEMQANLSQFCSAKIKDKFILSVVVMKVTQAKTEGQKRTHFF